MACRRHGSYRIFTEEVQQIDISPLAPTFGMMTFTVTSEVVWIVHRNPRMPLDADAF
jgi:hypothetical protein